MWKMKYQFLYCWHIAILMKSIIDVSSTKISFRVYNFYIGFFIGALSHIENVVLSSYGHLSCLHYIGKFQATWVRLEVI